MIPVRPRQLFSRVDDPDQAITFFLPSVAAGGLTAIESLVLIAILRILKPEKLFEFGTFKGYTTRLLLDNLEPLEGPAERVFTLDLPGLEAIAFQGDDRLLAEESLTTRRKYLQSGRSSWVRQLLQDSMTLDPEPLREAFQLIFIDGNHRLEYARRDSENAFRMLSRRPAAIVWHDYRNPQFPELGGYLEELAGQRTLYQVGDTMLVVYFNEAAGPL